MVRLVFRPYTQLRRSICTSESLRSSIRVSPDFNLARHSSPSFGSQRVRSCCSARYEVDAKRRGCARSRDRPSAAAFAFTAPLGFVHPMARAHVKLLGPCFKTGRRGRRPTRDRDASRANEDTRYTSSPGYPPPPEPGAGSLGRPEGHPKLHPRPRSGDSGSSREGAVECSRRPGRPRRAVLADPQRPGCQAFSLNHRPRLREPLRLLLHSFTYF